MPAGDAHTLVLAAVVPKAAIINHWGEKEAGGDWQGGSAGPTAAWGRTRTLLVATE